MLQFLRKSVFDKDKRSRSISNLKFSFIEERLTVFSLSP